MLILYGVHRSRASRPIWLLHEIGMAFDHRPVIQAYRLGNPGAADAPDNTASPSFLAVNPLGQIPCMVDGDLVLTESLAITLYIARRYGGALGPQDVPEEAQMMNWTLFAATAIEAPALDILMAHGRGEATTEAGAAEIAARLETLRRPMSRLEAHLGEREWMVGGRFTAADINVAEVVRYAMPAPELFDAAPALRRWLAACHDRPAFKRMMAEREREPA